MPLANWAKHIREDKAMDERSAGHESRVEIDTVDTMTREDSYARNTIAEDFELVYKMPAQNELCLFGD